MKNKTLVGILIAILFIFNFYLLVINRINKSKITGLSDIKQEITNYILEYQGTTEHLLQNSGFPLDSIFIVEKRGKIDKAFYFVYVSYCYLKHNISKVFLR